MATTPDPNLSCPEQGEFSLVLGGPFFQLLRRAHLAGDALELLKKRVVVISLLAWLPLLILASWQGRSGPGVIAFWQDLEVHVRFLVALPLLVLAELVVHRRTRPLVTRFVERGLIPEQALPRFRAAVSSALLLRNSLGVEFLLVLVVYGVGVEVIWLRNLALTSPTWYATPSPEGLQLTLAGLWYGFVSLPIFQFLLVRWYFRVLIWALFLARLARIPLRLVPTHPDRAGGLGFLAGVTEGFTPLLVAHGALFAGHMGTRILYTGAQLADFKVDIVVLLGFLLLLVLGPLLLFTPQLHQARLKGLGEYGTLAQDYVRAFDEKWLRGGAPPGESLLGSGDVQSLADLGNSFEVIQTMRVVPFSREPVTLVMATLAPFVPLGLTMMPLEELVKKLVGILF